MSDPASAVEAAPSAAASAPEPEVLVELRDGIKTITINRPRKKNALTHGVEMAILEAVRASASDPATRVTILTGAGGDFSAGADLSAGMGGKAYDVTTHLREDVHPIVAAIRASDKPFIAKVRGSAVGVGCNFALGCDLIYASENARFSQIFARIGLATDGGGSYHMVRAMGWPRAFERIVTGAMIPAAEAVQLGLINRAVPDEELDALVDQMARALAAGPQISIRMCKSNLRTSMDGTIDEALETEAVNQGQCFKSKDFAEGVMAFMQKRKPNFKGE